MNRGTGAERQPNSGAAFRPDVQGLRAVAVLMVVVYHLAPSRLPGGYVGVDVFFVISGYLITRHLLQEVMETGRLQVVRFWSRRVRRLLPASLLVLLVSLVLVWLWVPQTEWNANARQVTASALYFQNWALLADAVDYSALGASATVAQHYWSLSVEEQFYVLWPILIVGLIGLERLVKGGAPSPHRLRRHLLVLLILTAASSLTWSVVATAADAGAAYFNTFTRIWEFALGGLAGLLWTRTRVGRGTGAALAWVGLAAILWAGLRYDDTTAFPGWTALVPVLGAVALIVGGHVDAAFAPRWLTWRPVTFLGDVSYAIYLWHWPLFVVAPHMLGRELERFDKASIVVLTVLLAWGSTRLVENPLRTGPVLRSTSRALLIGAVGMVVVVVAAGAVRMLLPDEQPFAAPHLASCVGPGALDPANGCVSVVGEEPPNPGPVVVAQQNRERIAYPGCLASFEGSELRSCDLGVPQAQARATVALVGDSHAAAWFPALDALGKQQGWLVRTFGKTSCPVTSALRVLPNETAKDNQSDCEAWVRRVSAEVTTPDRYDMVFAAAYSTAYEYESSDEASFADPALDGYVDMWRQWRAAGLDVVVLSDVPRTNGDYVPTCLAATDDPMDCAVPRADALPQRLPITQAAEIAERDGVHLIDLTDRFCDERWCYPVVGSLIVYRDYSHLSKEYAEALAPVIAERLPRELIRAGQPPTQP